MFSTGSDPRETLRDHHSPFPGSIHPINKFMRLEKPQAPPFFNFPHNIPPSQMSPFALDVPTLLKHMQVLKQSTQ